jgi:MFS family permease
MEFQLRLLKNRNFAWYWLSSLLAGLGDAALTLALKWLVVTRTGSGAMLGAMLATIGIPRVVLTLFAGVWVDRMNPANLLVLCEWVRVLVVGGLVLLSLGGTLPVWSLFAAAFLFGCLEAFFWPAASAIQQRMVEPKQYTQASGLLMIAMKTTAIVGPVAGGTLVALGGNRIVMIGALIAFGISLWCLRLIRLSSVEAAAERAGKKSFRDDLLEGFRFIRRTPLVLATSISALLVNFCSASALVGVLFLARAFGQGAEGYGLLNMSIGIGGTVGAVLFSLAAIKRPTPRMTQAACMAEGLIFATIALSGNFMLTVCLIGLIGITDAAVNVIAPSVNRLVIPQAMFGRVISTLILCMSSSVPLAEALSGWLVEGIGVHRLFAISGGLEIVTAGVCFFLPAIRFYHKSCNSSATSGC